MDGLHKIAALASLVASVGIGPRYGGLATGFGDSERCFVHDPSAKRPTFTSDKPLTKRQKRRLRGKAKP